MIPGPGGGGSWGAGFLDLRAEGAGSLDSWAWGGGGWEPGLLGLQGKGAGSDDFWVSGGGDRGSDPWLWGR